MTLRRIAMWIVAAVIAVGSVLVLTADVKVGDANCGSALVPRDPTALSIETNLPVDDAMRDAIVRARCDHAVTGRRAMGGIPAVAAIALAVLASRTPTPEPFNGERII